MNDWKIGDRVIVRLPDNHGDYGVRGRAKDFPGTVVGVNNHDHPGVSVHLDQRVNGVRDCYATHGELRRA